MSELLYKDEVFKLVGLSMEVHRELGKGQDEVLYKDAFLVELQRAQIPFTRELKYEVTYKGVILPHHYYADFVVWDKIMFEAKAVERLTDAHVKQVLNYLAISELELGLLVNFGADSLEWKRVIRSQKTKPPELVADFRLKIRANQRNSRKLFFSWKFPKHTNRKRSKINGTIFG